MERCFRRDAFSFCSMAVDIADALGQSHTVLPWHTLVPIFPAKRVKWPPFCPPHAENQVCHEPEFIAMVFGTSRRPGPALYIRQKVTVWLPCFQNFCEKDCYFCGKFWYIQHKKAETLTFFILRKNLVWMSGAFLRPSGAPTPPNLRSVIKNRNVFRIG